MVLKKILKRIKNKNKKFKKLINYNTICTLQKLTLSLVNQVSLTLFKKNIFIDRATLTESVLNDDDQKTLRLEAARMFSHLSVNFFIHRFYFQRIHRSILQIRCDQ